MLVTLYGVYGLSHLSYVRSATWQLAANILNLNFR
jgi:hypothetical protein